MIKAYGWEYFLSLGFILVLTLISVLILKNKDKIYKNLVLNFLAFFMLLVNLLFVLAKYNWESDSTHLLLSLMTVGLSAVFTIIIFILEKFNKNKLSKTLKMVLAISIIALQILFMVLQGFQGVSIYFFGHLCNQMSWLLALCILVFPNSKIINYAYYAALVGAVISLAYPATFKETASIFHFDFFRNVFGHGAMLFATAFMWQTNLFKSTTKQLYYLPVGLSISYLYAFVANLIANNFLGTNANYLFLNRFPVPYLNSYISAIIGVGITYLVVYLLEKYEKKKDIKKQEK